MGVLGFGFLQLEGYVAFLFLAIHNFRSYLALATYLSVCSIYSTFYRLLRTARQANGWRISRHRVAQCHPT